MCSCIGNQMDAVFELAHGASQISWAAADLMLQEKWGFIQNVPHRCSNNFQFLTELKTIHEKITVENVINCSFSAIAIGVMRVLKVLRLMYYSSVYIG